MLSAPSIKILVKDMTRSKQAGLFTGYTHKARQYVSLYYTYTDVVAAIYISIWQQILYINTYNDQQRREHCANLWNITGRTLRNLNKM